MRSLKFRAWVSYGEKLKEPNYSRDYDSLDRFFEDHDENDTDQCIEQYTGLKDKNGKEIYEGDILTAFGNYYKVVFESERSGFVAKRVDAPKDDFFAGYFGRYLVKHCEVIGKIHENPELLEGEDGKSR